MVDDDLFPGTEESYSSTGNGADTQAAAAAAAAAGRPLSHEDVAGIVEKYIGPNVAQLQAMTRTQQQQSEVLTNLAATLGRLGLNNSNNEGQAVDVSEFLSNPEATIRALAERITDERVQQQVAPLLSQLVNQSHTSIVNEQKTEVDRQFGGGTWDNEFAPELNPMFDRVRKDSPSQLGNRDAIIKAVQAVKGVKFDTLVTARTNTFNATAEAEKAEQTRALEFVRSNLSGGIGRTQSASALSEETKDFIEKQFRATGNRIDEKELGAALTSGATLTEWRDSQKALKK
ncbi:MAG: hypothetical protein E4G90_10725 [Gemmatimonadales bacterium]|nr:MAG: hypothetical protein E4G90_10725 [Gemmatimonadales bacterium]